MSATLVNAGPVQVSRLVPLSARLQTCFKEPNFPQGQINIKIHWYKSRLILTRQRRVLTQYFRVARASETRKCGYKSGDLYQRRPGVRSNFRIAQWWLMTPGTIPINLRCRRYFTSQMSFQIWRTSGSSPWFQSWDFGKAWVASPRQKERLKSLQFLAFLFNKTLK